MELHLAAGAFCPPGIARQFHACEVLKMSGTYGRDGIQSQEKV
jgi:hypothetical protein